MSFKNQIKNALLLLILISTSESFAQNRSFQLSSSENPAIQCTAMPISSANSVLQGLMQKIKGTGIFYQCSYQLTRLHVMLVSMAPNAQGDARTMSIKCTNPAPIGSYIYRASVGFQTANGQKVLRFENAAAGTSCAIVSPRAAHGLSSLQAQTQIIPQLLITPAEGVAKKE